jgi:hypothetical protein
MCSKGSLERIRSRLTQTLQYVDVNSSFQGRIGRLRFFLLTENSTSLLFLCKLNRGRGLKARFTEEHWGSTIETLFWIAASNFVISVMLSIAELVI